MKIGKITLLQGVGNEVIMENIELAPAELPDVEKLIDKLKELQIATMQAQQRRRVIPPPRPKKCDVDGCNETALTSKPFTLTKMGLDPFPPVTNADVEQVFIWFCGKHHRLFKEGKKP